MKRVLVVDDEVEAFRDVLEEILDGYAVSYAPSGRARTGKGISLLDGEVAFVGVDVHKKTYSVCVYTDVREVKAAWRGPSATARAIIPEVVRRHLNTGCDHNRQSAFRPWRLVRRQRHVAGRAAR